MSNHRFYNNLFGWIAFTIAFITYFLTMEPTASWWDCSEFIACSYKLEIGHPPGAPLFLLLGRIFSLFAGNHLSYVAFMVNMLSALMSAFTILFLFWTITAISRKYFIKNASINLQQSIIILGSGMLGSLAFTFSDSFWFSAVEGEVYATSSFFTAIVFWAMLKWESQMEDGKNNRWLLLTAYLLGLSIGVHLLNLLVIPAIVFMFYFKKYKTTLLGVVITSFLAIGMLGIVQYGVIPGLVYLASRFELVFVNGFHLGFGSGILCFSLVLFILFFVSIYISHKRRYIVLNTTILGLLFIILGYSSYIMIVIRANANPPLNENSPDHVFSFKAYLDREQYGNSPLFYGQYFTAKVISQKDGETIYDKGKEQYEAVGKKNISVYDEENSGFFPRMYSHDPLHIRAYKDWSGTPGDRCPTFLENLRFLVNYQVGFMYFRYFMWNFAGRQNDQQGNGSNYNGSPDLLHGNWICGIPIIDSRLGPQKNLPSSIKNDPSRTTFYLLPLIFGLVGLFFHFRFSPKDATVVTILFFMTGIAIVLYLNQTPYQARERDYAYVGSFYAFSIWIGLGLTAIWQVLSKKLKKPYIAIVILLFSVILVPGIMAKEGWRMHDRSGRRATADFAYNYLMSCEPDAILVTNGDNDTFPLWYAQEVENVRTDVRVLNYALSSGAWYTRQLHQKIYKSNPLPLTLSIDQYKEGINDYIPVVDKEFNGFAELKDIISLIGSSKEETKVTTVEGERISFLPTKKVQLSTDAAAMKRTGIIPSSLIDSIINPMQWELGKSYIFKNELLMLDLISTNQWKRPIYFSYPSIVRAIMNIEKYCSLEGYSYRYLPVKASNYIQGLGGINIDKTYNLFMNVFRWGGLNEQGVYIDGETHRNAVSFRNKFALLAQALILNNRIDSARKILDKGLNLFPSTKIPFDKYTLAYIQLYEKIGEKNKAQLLYNEINSYYSALLAYYESFEDSKIPSIQTEKSNIMQLLKNLYQLKIDIH